MYTHRIKHTQCTRKHSMLVHSTHTHTYTQCTYEAHTHTHSLVRMHTLQCIHRQTARTLVHTRTSPSSYFFPIYSLSSFISLLTCPSPPLTSLHSSSPPLISPPRIIRYNIERMRKCVQNGPDVHPGANMVRTGEREHVQYVHYSCIPYCTVCCVRTESVV